MKKAVVLGLSIGSLLISRLFSVNYAWGEHHLTFSAISIIGPSLGYLLGGAEIFVSVIGFSLIVFLFKGYSSVLITLGLPTLAAAYCLKFSSRWIQILIKVLLPLTCITLFNLHPVGSSAWYYSLYWLIPVVIFSLERLELSNKWFTALSSTFVAHAVGSIMFLYFLNTSTHLWLGLIPIVAFERMVLATAIFSLGIFVDLRNRVLSKARLKAQVS